jgi:O-antigen/teichoic acid export membrane protein
MSSNTENTKRLVKNTVYLYIRMLILILVSLYTSRVVLDKLGVSDYGIYNVVGGLSSMFIFFRSSLADGSQRFLSIELGKGNTKGANDIFCQHLVLYEIAFIIVLIIGETFGLWFVINKLTIPPGRMTAAVWVYQFTLISLGVTLIEAVFNAEIVAHEQMKIYAYVGILDGLAKLGVAFLISITPFDRLISYGFLMLMVSVFILFVYIIYCVRNFDECKFYFIWDKKLLGQTVRLFGWNTCNSTIFSLNSAGLNVLVNMFFGPVVNAARGVAVQINNATSILSNNVFKAVRPQMIKLYALNESEYLRKLLFSVAKYTFLLFWVLGLPVMFWADSILDLWLKEVPEYAMQFTIWVIIYSLICEFREPFWIIALACGKLKKFVLYGDMFFLSVFPLTYVAFKLGYSPISMYVILVVVRVLYQMIYMKIVKEYFDYSVKDYCIQVLLPLVKVVIPTLIITFFCKLLLPDGFLFMFVGFSLSIIGTVIISWLLCTSRSERSYIKSILQSKLQKISNN